MCFQKVPTPEEHAKLNLYNHITISKQKYTRSLDQTYFTLPEWSLVDLVQEMGKFLEHTPYYMFPYWHSIKLYWRLFNKECNIVRKKSGFKKAYFSEYTVGGIVQGVTTTCILSLMSLLSFIPRWMYGSSDVATKVKLIINHPQNLDLHKIDPRIKILKSEQYDDQLMSLIEIPRYIPFRDILIQLSNNRVVFVEICGQKEIQLKIKQLPEQILNSNSKLFDYKMLPKDENLLVALSVKIDQLSQTIRTLQTDGYEILNIYDF